MLYKTKAAPVGKQELLPPAGAGSVVIDEHRDDFFRIKTRGGAVSGNRTVLVQNHGNLVDLVEFPPHLAVGTVVNGEVGHNRQFS